MNLVGVQSCVINHRGPVEVDLQGKDKFFKVSTVTADFRSAAQSLPCLMGPNGEQFYRLDCDIKVLFGLTEYEACICWKENVRNVLSLPFELDVDEFAQIVLQGQDKW